MRILFFSGPVLGHITRLLSIAQELRKINSSQIIFSVPEISNYISLVEQEGFGVEAIPLNGEPFPFVDQFPHTVESIIRDFEPDLIVIDWNMLRWASNIVWPDIPKVLITNVFLTELNSAATTVQDIMLEDFKDEFHQARLQRNLSPLTRAHELYNADYVVLADPKPVTDFFSSKPSNFFQAGACFLDLASQSQVDHNDLENILLISLGSTGNISITDDMIEQIKEISGCEKVVMVGKNHTNLTNLDIELKTAPLTFLMKKAKLVLTHGGAGSTYQALSFGKPLIIFSAHRNHRLLGELIEEIGAGICVQRNNFYDKIEKFSMGSMITEAERIGQRMQQENGPYTIAKFLNSFHPKTAP